MLRTVTATRYVTPLREGGSLPGLVEADDDGLYVVKFRGAGQGPRALVAEWVAGEIGRALGLRRPGPRRGRGRRAPRRRRARRGDPGPRAGQRGLNLGLDFLPGASPFNPAARPDVDPEIAATIVWLDGLVTNPDRTVANPNLLIWHGRLWCIDHGAALYIHHTWRDPDEHARRPFERIADHVLLPFAASIADARRARSPRGCRCDRARDIVEAIPDLWLPDDGLVGDADGPAARRIVATSRCASRRPAPSSRRPSVPDAPRSPYQYAIVRVVPRVDRGECLNVGVVLLCRPRRFLGARTALDDARLAAFAPDLAASTVQPHLDAIEAIARGELSGGPIASSGSPNGSTGWSRRRARSSSRRRSTPA